MLTYLPKRVDLYYQMAKGFTATLNPKQKPFSSYTKIFIISASPA